MNASNEIIIRRLIDADVSIIRGWPSYEGDFKLLDYALRPGGWLDTMPESSETHRYAATCNGDLAGFSILTHITPDAAEIYLAVKPRLTSKGVGRKMMELTLEKAFREMKLVRVYLKVRVWHKHAINLYEKLGFVTTGQTQLEIAGELLDFNVMDLQAGRFKPTTISQI